jgi:hypothetical protein
VDQRDLRNPSNLPESRSISYPRTLTRLTTGLWPSNSIPKGHWHVHPVRVNRRSSRQKRTVLHSRRHEILYLKGPVVRIDAPQLSKVVTKFVEPLVSGARANEGQRAYDTAVTHPATNAELSVSVLWGPQCVQIMTLNHIVLLIIAENSYFSDNFKYQSDSLITATCRSSYPNSHASRGRIYW